MLLLGRSDRLARHAQLCPTVRDYSVRLNAGQILIRKRNQWLLLRANSRGGGDCSVTLHGVSCPVSTVDLWTREREREKSSLPSLCSLTPAFDFLLMVMQLEPHLGHKKITRLLYSESELWQ